MRISSGLVWGACCAKVCCRVALFKKSNSDVDACTDLEHKHVGNMEVICLHVLKAVQRGHSVIVVSGSDKNRWELAIFRYSNVMQR